MTVVDRKAERALRTLLGPDEEIVAAIDMWPYGSVRSGVARFARGPVPDLAGLAVAVVGRLGRAARGRALSAEGVEIEIRRGPATVVATTVRVVVFELSSAGRFEGLLVEAALGDVELSYREPWHKWEPRQYRFRFADRRTWHAQPELTSNRDSLAAFETQLDAHQVSRRS